MAEYIEREAAIEAFRKELCAVYNDRNECLKREYATGFTGIRNVLLGLPAADVREVVTCEECKFYKAENKGKPWKSNRRYCVRSAAVATNPDDFCSRGEKREG